MKLILLLKLKSISIKKAVAPFIVLFLLLSGNVNAQTTVSTTLSAPTANSYGTQWVAGATYKVNDLVYHTDVTTVKVWKVTTAGTSVVAPTSTADFGLGALAGVAITGTGGQFSCTAVTGSTGLVVGNKITITGTNTGTGSITGYAAGKIYTISATNGTTTFTLTDNGTAIVTTAGTQIGLTYSGVVYTYLGTVTQATSTWTCPAGVTSIDVELWGGGGAGGSASTATITSGNRLAGGGGAGSYVKKTLTVVPGTTYNVTVGGGGYQGGTTTSTGYFGFCGGKSQFSGSGISTLTASGGTGGSGSGILNPKTAPGGVLGGVYGYSITGTNTTNYRKTITVGSTSITGTAGQFSTTTSSMDVKIGSIIQINGTITGTGSISGYVSGKNYYVIAASNGATSTFTISETLGGTAVTTVAGTLAGASTIYNFPIGTVSGGGGSGAEVTTINSGTNMSYVGAISQGTGYTTNPSVTYNIGAGYTIEGFVNPNINSAGDTVTLGSNGGNSSSTASGAGGANAQGAAGGAGGTGTDSTVGGFAGTNGVAVGSGGGGGFSYYSTGTTNGARGGFGANGQIIITYTPTIPSISVTPATLSGFSTVPTAPSTEQTFSVSGSLLEADIVITAPTNYEINNPLVDSTYGSTITLTNVSGSVAATTINVRLKTGLTGGTAYAENISVETTNGTTQTVACSGGVLAYYYYAGSGSLANVASWSTNTNGSGGSQPTNFTTVYQVFVIRNTTAVSTDVAWNVAGTGSIIQVGDPSVPGVALTIASGLDISTTAVDPVVGNGTIDIPAASSGVNSVIFQSASTPPGMGIMDANSEVHYQATISTSTNKTFGKMFIENNSTVTFTGKPIVQTSLYVAAGSTIPFSNSTGNYITVNETATVAIDGSIKSAKAAGIFSYGVSTPSTSFGNIQFKDAVGGLTLGSSSTVEYNRTDSTTAQPISTLPTGVQYNNLTLSDSGVRNNKLFSGAVTVNNTFTLNQSASTLTACENLTLANGATIVRTAGSLNVAPVFGTSVNVTYNGTTAITSGVELPTATSVLNNLTVNNTAGVTLGSSKTVNGVLNLTAGTLTTGANTLTLGGTPTVTAGNINASNSGATVSFTNTSAVALPASLFTGNVQNLTINGAGGVTLGSATSLAGILTVTSGVLTTSGFLILKSSGCCTASVGQLATGAVTGDVTVERYIPAKRAWRALTAPVVGNSNNSIFYNWQNNGSTIANTGVEIWSNASTDASVTNAGLSSSLLSYNSSSNSWTAITNTASAPLFSSSINNPFIVFVTGPYASTSTNITNLNTFATTLKATGNLLTGNQTYASVKDEYTFIGNPYASPLILSTMLTDGDNSAFSGNIWIWDAKAAGTNSVGGYSLYDNANGSYTNTTSNLGTELTNSTLIQSGQAFFVKQSTGILGSAVDFKIKEVHKGSVNSNAVFRLSNRAETLRVGLYKQVNNEWSGRDGAMTVILNDADANQLPNKMANGTENVAFTKNGLLFASEHHLPLVASDVLNVKVWNTTAGTNYKLKINTEQFNTTNLNATLEDVFTNSRTSIALDGTVVEYPFAVTTEAASTGNRFRIVFENSTLGINNPKASGISILPNPITGDAFQVNLGTLSTGTYSYSISNALGQEVENGSINNVTQNTSYTVKFKNNTAAGMYIMKVTGTDNSVFTAKIIKQ